MRNARTILILLIVAGCFSSCKFFEEHKLFSKDEEGLEVKKEAPMVEEESKAEVVEDSVQIETIEQEITPVEVPEEPVAPTEGYGSNRYYMVVGSFLNKEFADKYAQKMLDQGYDPQIIFSSSAGFYRVSAKSYENYQVAINDIENFRNSVTPRAWVHVKK